MRIFSLLSLTIASDNPTKNQNRISKLYGRKWKNFGFSSGGKGRGLFVVPQGSGKIYLFLPRRKITLLFCCQRIHIFVSETQWRQTWMCTRLSIDINWPRMALQAMSEWPYATRLFINQHCLVAHINFFRFIWHIQSLRH